MKYLINFFFIGARGIYKICNKTSCNAFLWNKGVFDFLHMLSRHFSFLVFPSKIEKFMVEGLVQIDWNMIIKIINKGELCWNSIPVTSTPKLLETVQFKNSFIIASYNSVQFSGFDGIISVSYLLGLPFIACYISFKTLNIV